MNEKPTHLDLFAGVGGFSIAFEAEGFKTIAYSEITPYKCLIYEHHFPGVPNLGPIESIRGHDIRATLGTVDVLTGGVPCQPASALGQMRGSADERWLWPEAIRLVREIRPGFAVFENPPSLLILEGGRAWNGIVSGLAAVGYDCWWDVFPAAAFGAGHLRERVLLIIADSVGRGRSSHGTRQHGASNQSQDACNANGSGFQRHSRHGTNDRRATTERRIAETTLQSSPSDAKRMGPQERLERRDRQSHDCAGQERVHADQTVAASHPRKVEILRGRVNRPDWWHEANTGIPVLAHGISHKLAEAVARCAGDAVCPQVIQPIARAIHQMLMQ